MESTNIIYSNTHYTLVIGFKQTRKANQPHGVKNDASARPSNLTLALCDLEL